MERRTFLKSALGVGAATLATGASAKAREPVQPNPESYGMLYDATKCIGCKTCVVACADANGLPRESRPGADAGLYQDPLDLSSKTKNVIRLFDDGSKRSFVKRQCMHCVDPSCTSACMIGALHKDEHDVVAYDPDRCIGCRYCQIACPYGVPQFEWDKRAPLIVKCELCRHRYADNKGAACCEVCPTGAVIFGARGELLEEAKRRLAASPERYSGEIYGDGEGGGTQVLYLAAQGIAFGDLGLPPLGDEPVPLLSDTLQHGIYQGFVAPTVLYAALGAAVWRSKRSESEDGAQGKEAGK